MLWTCPWDPLIGCTYWFRLIWRFSSPVIRYSKRSKTGMWRENQPLENHNKLLLNGTPHTPADTQVGLRPTWIEARQYALIYCFICNISMIISLTFVRSAGEAWASLTLCFDLSLPRPVSTPYTPVRYICNNAVTARLNLCGASQLPEHAVRYHCQIRLVRIAPPYLPHTALQRCRSATKVPVSTTNTQIEQRCASWWVGSRKPRDLRGWKWACLDQSTAGN